MPRLRIWLESTRNSRFINSTFFDTKVSNSGIVNTVDDTIGDRLDHFVTGVVDDGRFQAEELAFVQGLGDLFAGLRFFVAQVHTTGT